MTLAASTLGNLKPGALRSGGHTVSAAASGRGRYLVYCSVDFHRNDEVCVVHRLQDKQKIGRKSCDDCGTDVGGDGVYRESCSVYLGLAVMTEMSPPGAKTTVSGSYDGFYHST